MRREICGWFIFKLRNINCVKLAGKRTVLLLRGADRDADRKDGSTALFKAAFKGHSHVIEELLKFSPSLGLLKNGSTALHAAVMGGNLQSVALLLSANADPTLPNKNNELPGELTKSDRILRALRPLILNDSMID